MEEGKQISRKDFLKGVGTTIAGVTVVGALGSVLSGCSSTPETPPVANTKEKPQWPFKYTKVDPDKVAERAYKAYKEKGG